MATTHAWAVKLSHAQSMASVPRPRPDHACGVVAQASFFAKNIMRKDDDPRQQTRDDDICKALITMIAQNLAQIAHLNARIHGAKRVFFTVRAIRKR